MSPHPFMGEYWMMPGPAPLSLSHRIPLAEYPWHQYLAPTYPKPVNYFLFFFTNLFLSYRIHFIPFHFYLGYFHRLFPYLLLFKPYLLRKNFSQSFLSHPTESKSYHIPFIYSITYSISILAYLYL